MSEFTKGDWTENGYAIVDCEGNTICIVGELSGWGDGYKRVKNDKANSRLIRQSGKMFEVVVYERDRIQAVLNGFGDYKPVDMTDRLAELEAIIASVEGK